MGLGAQGSRSAAFDARTGAAPTAGSGDAFALETSVSPDGAMAQAFLAEYAEHLNAVRRDLLGLARGTETDTHRPVNRVLRAAHAIRGAGFFGLANIAELAQGMEESMTSIALRGVALRPHQIRVLLLASDRLSEMIQNHGAGHAADIAGIMAALGRLHGEPMAESLPRQADPALSGSRTLRGLVCEDDLASRLLMTAFLSRYGQCDAAVNGREAVDAFRNASGQARKYDLVCMDVRMPEMDGPEAVRRIRELECDAGISAARGVKVVIMTAVDDLGEVIRCFEEFSDAYLMKPVNLTNLLRQLKSWRLIPPRLS
jgi:two-component system chemotaxis response regulator CheY